MDGIESFSQERNMARLKAGLKGGSWFENPIKVPARRIVNGWPSEVIENLQSKLPDKGIPSAPWAYRR